MTEVEDITLKKEPMWDEEESEYDEYLIHDCFDSEDDCDA